MLKSVICAVCGNTLPKGHVDFVQDLIYMVDGQRYVSHCLDCYQSGHWIQGLRNDILPEEDPDE